MNVERYISGPIAANCYVIELNGETAVVDCGGFSDEIKERLDGVKVRYILLTHGHADHILGVYDLKQAHPEAEVVIHELDAEYLTNGRIHELDTKILEQGFGDAAGEIYMGGIHYMNADRTVKDGDVLDFGGTRICVIHTPGHTKGGVCWLFPESKKIFTGDTLFCLTVGRTDLTGGSDEEMLRSITLLYNNENINDIYPGHNRETTMEYEKRRNRYMRRFK